VRGNKSRLSRLLTTCKLHRLWCKYRDKRASSEYFHLHGRRSFVRSPQIVSCCSIYSDPRLCTDRRRDTFPPLHWFRTKRGCVAPNTWFAFPLCARACVRERSRYTSAISGTVARAFGSSMFDDWFSRWWLSIVD